MYLSDAESYNLTFPESKKKEIAKRFNKLSCILLTKRIIFILNRNNSQSIIEKYYLDYGKGKRRNERTHVRQLFAFTLPPQRRIKDNNNQYSRWKLYQIDIEVYFSLILVPRLSSYPSKSVVGLIRADFNTRPFSSTNGFFDLRKQWQYQSEQYKMCSVPLRS